MLCGVVFDEGCTCLVHPFVFSKNSFIVWGGSLRYCLIEMFLLGWKRTDIKTNI